VARFRREDLDSRVKPPPTSTAKLSFSSIDAATGMPQEDGGGTNRTPPRRCQPVSRIAELLAAGFHLLRDGILARVSASGLSVLQPRSCSPVGNLVAPRANGARGPRQASQSSKTDRRPEARDYIMVKKLTFAVLAFSWFCAFECPNVIAQNNNSQSVVTTDTSADAFLDLHMALLRKDIHSIKKAFISKNLGLTEGEATGFWPLYEQYSTSFDKISAMRTALVEEYANEYGTMTEEQADSLVRRWLDTDIEAAQLRQKYVPIVRKVLPAKKAATFFQLDRRISMMIDVQLTTQLPLLQSQD